MTSIDALRTVAVEQAAALGSGFVGSEHLFLAWLMTGAGPAHEAAAAAGLNSESFRAMLGSRTGPAPAGATVGDGGLSSHAQRVLTVAGEIATARGLVEPSGDDALLAMIREPRGAIARALTQAKLKPTQLKAMVIGNASRRPESRAKSQPAPRESQPVRSRRDAEVDEIPEPRAPERPRLAPPPKPERPPPTRRWSPYWILYVAIPISFWYNWSGVSSLALFASACVAIIPLARLIAVATNHLADRTGPMLGALLNAAFGNATEVIVAIAALRAGYIDLVKASLSGSILGNLLLILGLALFTGGLRQPILRFNRTAAGMSAAMLALAVAALVLPSLLAGASTSPHLVTLSGVVAAILAVTYFGSLIFTLRTHKQLFAVTGRSGVRPWPTILGIAVLAIATVLVAFESQFLVDTISPVTQTLGLSQVFVGLIVIPIVGNAAEHATAVLAARSGKTELALQIALGSSTQVALLVAPILVLAGALVGQQMTLVFPAFQIVGLAMGVVVAAFITLDGESHWFEGLQLLALYAMIATAAWFI